MNKNCGNCGVDTVNNWKECYECTKLNDGVPSRWVEGDNYVPESISLRAVQCIKKRAKKNAVRVSEELDKIEVSRELFFRWGKDACTISAYFLRQMALNGYDTFYILTGRRNPE